MKKVVFALLIMAVIVLVILLIDTMSQGARSPYENTGEDMTQTEDGSSGAPQQDIPDSSGEKEDADFINDLKQMYSHTEIEVTDIIDVSDEYTLINIDLKISTNKFFLYSSATGSYEELPVMGADLKNVISENYFIFEDRGESGSDFKSVPDTIRCFRVNGEESFSTIHEKEIFELTREIQTGHKDGELLSNIVVTSDGIEAVFKPYDESEHTEFYAAATDIPTTNTYYVKDTREFVIEFYTTHISPDLRYDLEYATEENFYISSFKLVEQDNKCAVIMALRDETQNYTCETLRSPAVGSGGQYPYFVLTFGAAPGV